MLHFCSIIQEMVRQASWEAGCKTERCVQEGNQGLLWDQHLGEVEEAGQARGRNRSVRP